MIAFAVLCGAFGLVMVVQALRDLGGASDDTYESPVGHNKPAGWAWTVIGLIAAIMLWSMIGAGL